MRYSLLSAAALPLAAQAFDLFEVVDKAIDQADKVVGDIADGVGNFVDNIGNDVANDIGTVTDNVFEDDNSFVEREGILRFPMKVAHGASKHSKSKRQQAADITSRQTGYFYTIELKMGTPGQAVHVNFDTGSPELWVNPNCAKATNETYCKSFGQFGGSSSFVDQKQSNTLAYGTGTAEIEYGYDYVTVGSAKINQQIFGVATDSDFYTTGILGAGPTLDGWDSKYPLVIDNLLQQKFIESRAFSLDLRSIGSDRGAVVYGGIDTKKFSGHLEKRPIIPAASSPDGNTRYWIYLDGITINNEDGSVSPVFNQVNGQPVLLDSGYTVSALPTKHFQKILKAFPSAHKDENGQWNVDCKVAESTKGSVNFKFGKTVIKVPFKDFVWQQPAYGTCALGVMEDNEFPVLGDTFLRAAYAVFDWDNKNIHLANNEDCGSNLVKITSGPNAVPDIEGDCGKPVPTTSSAAPATTSAANNTTSAPVTTGTGGPIISTSAAGKWNATSTKPTYTSTIKTTSVHTVTSCAPTVTNCPVGQLTTEVITRYTTWCPGDSGAPPAPTSTSSYSKPPCPEVTLTIVLPKTIYCKEGMTGCKPGETITTENPGTVVPITPGPKPTEIPGCKNCDLPTVTAVPTTEVPTSEAPAATQPTEIVPPVVPVETAKPPPPPPATTMQIQPTGGCTNCGPNETQPPMTAGAAGGFAPGAAAMAIAAMVAVAL